MWCVINKYENGVLRWFDVERMADEQVMNDNVEGVREKGRGMDGCS
jgi:hypothetical protein